MKKIISNVEDVSKFVDFIINEAVDLGVSDIHFEPRKDLFCVRYRLDGDLIDKYYIENSYVQSIISRIKIISNMDITIKRTSQDGRIDFNFEDKNIDIRVASVPLICGEKIVMRILNSSKFDIHIDNLGLSENEKEVIKRVIKSPNGVAIISGPTG